MKNDKYRTYIYWGVTALAVLLLLVAAVFVVIRWSLVAALGAKSRTSLRRLSTEQCLPIC